MSLKELLQEFANGYPYKNKGPLCVALVVTRHAKKLGLPLNPEKLFTDAGGQVLGLGKSAVQSILKEHGVDRILAGEGGRTSRGSIGNMRQYVAFLNNLHERNMDDLTEIENWWIDRVKEYFASKPFILRYDKSKSFRTIIRDLFIQAEQRQAQSPGSTFAGTMLQHLVGGKLNLILDTPVESHGASVADKPTGREGDFILEDVAIHVTTAPSEALLAKCQRNINNGLRPIIITIEKKVDLARELAEQIDIEDRIDFFDAEQFLVGNIYELSKFSPLSRKTTADNLINEYNKIIKECETDPSLRIMVDN